MPRVDLEAGPQREKTVGDRKFAIDAALVRVMKSRKAVSYEELVAEAVRQLPLFRPEVRDIRRRIEDLITREYIERDAADHTILKYIA